MNLKSKGLYYGLFSGFTRAMALNISYSAWAIILSFFILGTLVTFKLVFFSAVILFGSVMTVATAQEMKFKKLFKAGRTV
ncbi:hypothetical protein DYI25_15080 [Mesobacillus boroniphilus]|uniref:Uncharacterized protein n=1 Tax=Mesobacillus boroniphilus TaxID=308892 RepID=A0A944GX88_9BACI|nr:hypothetical protein [Mesobacillus boroniphilus]MBS8265748.1 hypothetical protein [Mesobacillus boroniphilus]